MTLSFSFITLNLAAFVWLWVPFLAFCLFLIYSCLVGRCKQIIGTLCCISFSYPVELVNYQIRWNFLGLLCFGQVKQNCRRPCPSVSFVHDLDKKIFGRCTVYSWVLMIRCVKFCFGFKRLLFVETLSLAFDMKVMATKVAETLPVLHALYLNFLWVKIDKALLFMLHSVRAGESLVSQSF